MPITPLQKKKELYSDFNIDLVRHPVTNDVSRIINENSIKESIRNIILTNWGERPFAPEFGGNITAQLFENHTPITMKTIETRVRKTIAKHEPRVELLGVSVNSDPDTNELRVYIEFVSINSENPQTIDVLLKRVR